MLASLVLAALTLRSGLALRQSRIGRLRRTPEMRPRHLRLAKPAVAMLLIGFAAGPASAVWLRDWEPLRSFHGIAGLVAAALFAVTAVVGHRLEEGRTQARDAHAILGGLALLVAALATVAGFVLLP